MFTRKFDRRVYVAIGVVLFAATLGGAFGTYVLWPSNLEAGYEPEQPLPYSHKMHAGTLAIPCLYCHVQAEKGPYATVPALSVCMNCHQEVQPKDEAGRLKPGMAVLLDHWQKREPIMWQKVNDLADFAYFDHSRHMAGGLTCQECHGPIETMEHVRREYGLKMSWCLACHKQPPPAGSPAEARGWPTRAPINCTTCHR
jgi:menaquinone reductase, multiheme cytochrome c subunit